MRTKNRTSRPDFSSFSAQSANPDTNPDIASGLSAAADVIRKNRTPSVILLFQSL